MHEYGHYLQSRELGWSYLFEVGIPSIISAGNSKFISGDGIYNPDGIWTHNVNIFERDANKRAAVYFSRYGVTWTTSAFYKFPIGYPGFSDPTDYSYLNVMSFYFDQSRRRSYEER